MKLLREKKLAIFSFGRSDFGILKELIIELNKNLKVDLIASGAHNSKIFGNTINEIREHKLNFYKILIHYGSNVKNNTAKIFNDVSSKTYNFLKKKNYSHVIILGDRYEALATALTCFNLGIKIIHIGGGSITEGSLDQIYRNAISQLSKIHLVETKFHKKQLFKMNIKKNVFVTGSLSLDGIKRKKLVDKEVFQKKFRISFLKKKKIFIVVFHPDTTISINKNISNLKTLIVFLRKFEENIIFTYPNADEGYQQFINIIDRLNKYRNFFVIKNLGQNMYFSALKFSNLLIGNSSSGIIEAPSFKIPILNLGNRQKNRVAIKSVINAKFNSQDLQTKYDYINTKKYIDKLKRLKNIYERPNIVKNAKIIILRLIKK